MEIEYLNREMNVLLASAHVTEMAKNSPVVGAEIAKKSAKLLSQLFSTATVTIRPTLPMESPDVLYVYVRVEVTNSRFHGYHVYVRPDFVTKFRMTVHPANPLEIQSPSREENIKRVVAYFIESRVHLNLVEDNLIITRNFA